MEQKNDPSWWKCWFILRHTMKSAQEWIILWFSWHIYALAGHCAYLFHLLSDCHLMPQLDGKRTVKRQRAPNMPSWIKIEQMEELWLFCVRCFHSGPNNCSNKVRFYVEIIHLRCLNLKLMAILFTEGATLMFGRTKVTLFVRQESLSRQEGHEHYNFIHSPRQERFCQVVQQLPLPWISLLRDSPQTRRAAGELGWNMKSLHCLRTWCVWLPSPINTKQKYI